MRSGSMSSSFRGSKKPYKTCQYAIAVAWHGAYHTGPVRVLFDLVLHVPTISAGQVPWAAASAARLATPAREYFMMIVRVAGVVNAWSWAVSFGCCFDCLVCLRSKTQDAKKVGAPRRRGAVVIIPK